MRRLQILATLVAVAAFAPNARAADERPQRRSGLTPGASPSRPTSGGFRRTGGGWGDDDEAGGWLSGLGRSGGGLFGGGGGGSRFGGGFGGRDSAQIFLNIAKGTHDKTEERVVWRGSMSGGRVPVVTFVAQFDPLNPRSQARLRGTRGNENGDRLSERVLNEFMGDHGFEGSSLRFEDRAHLLVVPGVTHKNVGRTGQITRDDIKFIDELFGVAESVGAQLLAPGFKVFQNDASAASVRQAHIHLTGAWKPGTTVPDLEPPSGGRARGVTIRGGRVVDI